MQTTPGHAYINLELELWHPRAWVSGHCEHTCCIGDIAWCLSRMEDWTRIPIQSFNSQDHLVGELEYNLPTEELSVSALFLCRVRRERRQFPLRIPTLNCLLTRSEDRIHVTCVITMKKHTNTSDITGLSRWQCSDELGKYKPSMESQT